MTTTRGSESRPRGRIEGGESADVHSHKLRKKERKVEEALRAALYLHEGAQERWDDLKRDGATDAQIWGELQIQFGGAHGGGGSTSDGGTQFAFAGERGSASVPPKFWIDCSSHFTSQKPTLQGSALVKRVRALLEIPPLKPITFKPTEAPAAPPANPFLCPEYGPNVQTIDAPGRLRKVKSFGVAELRQVLALPDVQKTVRQAAERRLKKLEKERGGSEEAAAGSQGAQDAPGDESAARDPQGAGGSGAEGESGAGGAAGESAGGGLESAPPEAASVDGALDDTAGSGDEVPAAGGQDPHAGSGDGRPAQTARDLSVALSAEAPFAALEFAARRRLATVRRLDARIEGAKKGSNLKRQLETQRADASAAFDLAFHNAHAADGLPAEQVEAIRARVESAVEKPSASAFERPLLALLVTIKNFNRAIERPQNSKRGRKELVKRRAPYTEAWSDATVYLGDVLGGQERTALFSRVQSEAKRIVEELDRAERLAEIEAEQRGRFTQLLGLDVELTREGVKPRERNKLEEQRVAVREKYVAAFRVVAAKWGGAEADALRLRVEPRSELSDEDAAALLAEIEREQRERYFALKEIERQLGEEGLTPKRRAKLEREQAQAGAGYARGYAAGVGRLGVKAVETLRAKIEGDDDPLFSTPAPAIAGARVEADPSAVFDHKCEFPLEERDIAERAKRLAHNHAEIERLKQEKDESAAGYKLKINALEEQNSTLFDEIERGRATEEIKVFERRNYERKVVEFVRAGSDTVVDSRPMKPRELQARLF